MTERWAPMTDSEVRLLGFEPTERGWVPRFRGVDERMKLAMAHRSVPIGKTHRSNCVVCCPTADESGDTP